jgi:hypothetical protein
MEFSVHTIGSYRSHLRQARAAKLAMWRGNVGAAWLLFEAVAIIFVCGALFGRFIS